MQDYSINTIMIHRIINSSFFPQDTDVGDVAASQLDQTSEAAVEESSEQQPQQHRVDVGSLVYRRSSYQVFTKLMCVKNSETNFDRLLRIQSPDHFLITHAGDSKRTHFRG